MKTRDSQALPRKKAKYSLLSQIFALAPFASVGLLFCFFQMYQAPEEESVIIGFGTILYVMVFAVAAPVCGFAALIYSGAGFIRKEPLIPCVISAVISSIIFLVSMFVAFHVFSVGMFDDILEPLKEMLDLWMDTAGVKLTEWWGIATQAFTKMITAISEWVESLFSK